jgi:hypothetical protein
MAAFHPERTYSKGAKRENSSTSTAKDLVAGSALGFQENVTKSFKGLPGRWRLYSARQRAAAIES